MADGKFDKLTVTDNVGIGTTSPLGKLEVQGNEQCLLALNYTAPAPGGPAIHFMQNGHAAAWAFLDLAKYCLNIGTSTTNPIVSFHNDGKVGIGTASPVVNLHVTSPGGYGALMLGDNGGTNNVHLTHETNGDFGIWNGTFGGGNTLLYIKGGNIGIGTMAPQAKLHVQGDIQVTGDIFLQNADCAEEFAVAGCERIDPGTVMVLDEDGALRQSKEAYDKKVAGVISGAGDLKPGLILDKQPESTNRVPIALMGKANCKVDAQYAAIEVGDLLTTSPTPGHAMKATDPAKAFGTVIGKALKPLMEGTGLIPILISLQ